MYPRLPFAERKTYAQNLLAKDLYQCILDKKTNLALSADVTHCEVLLALAEKLGPEICVLKTHVDILEDFSPQFIVELQKIAQYNHFFIFEDRKFADIGSTVRHQYTGGMYKIADWAHIVNAHTLPGPGIISGLSHAGLSKNRGLLLLAEMSSQGNLLDAAYAQKTVQMAEKFPEFVMGFIAQRKLSADPKWIYMTPGVQLKAGIDDLGQQYVTPEKAIKEFGTDIIIVGRGILTSKDPLSEAQQYRKAAWQAL